MSPSTPDLEVTRFLDAWLGVRQLIQAANFNRFQSAGLSATQFMTLNLLPAGAEGITMGDLARQMNLRPATVARTVASLEARHLLTRAPSHADRRRRLVSITASGAALQNSAAGHFRRHIESLFRAMSADQRTGLVQGLESLLRVDGERAPAGAPPARSSSPPDPARPARATGGSRARGAAAPSAPPLPDTAPRASRSARRSRRP